MDSKVFNIEDLTDNLSKNYQDLIAGKLSIKKAKAVAELSGKLIKSASVQLEYNKYLKNDSTINFLEKKK